jgi:hypothetical protein
MKYITDATNSKSTIGSFAKLFRASKKPFSFLKFRLFCPNASLAFSTSCWDNPVISKLVEGIIEYF